MREPDDASRIRTRAYVKRLDGYMYRIYDDMNITGPEYVWLTLVAGEAEGVSADKALGDEASPQALRARDSSLA